MTCRRPRSIVAFSVHDCLMRRWLFLFTLVAAFPAQAQSDRADLVRDLVTKPYLADQTIRLAGYGGIDDAPHSLDAVRDTLTTVLAASSADTLAWIVDFLGSDAHASFQRLETAFRVLSPEAKAELTARAEGLLQRSSLSRADLLRRMSAAWNHGTLDQSILDGRLLRAVERDEPETYERVVEARADQYALEQARMSSETDMPLSDGRARRRL